MPVWFPILFVAVAIAVIALTIWVVGLLVSPSSRRKREAIDRVYLLNMEDLRETTEGIVLGHGADEALDRCDQRCEARWAALKRGDRYD